ncbi:MAG: DUF2065 domain-containing protein [Paracoccaceae bacterium]
MIDKIIFAIGFLAIAEGLALALAPSRMGDILRLLAALPRQTLHQIAISMIAAGAILLWVAS